MRRRLVRLLSGGPARFVLILGLLGPPWPFLGRVYGREVTALAENTLAPAALPVTLRFGAAAAGADRDNPWRLLVHAEAPDGRYVGTVLDLRRSGYIASAVFAALALATPVGGRRRLGLLVTGLALLQALPLLPVVYFFSGTLPVQAFDLGAPLRAAVAVAYHALIAPPGMAYALPALLWLLLAWTFTPAPGHAKRPGPVSS